MREQAPPILDPSSVTSSLMMMTTQVKGKPVQVGGAAQASFASFGEYVDATKYALNQAARPAQTLGKAFKSASDFAQFPDKSKQPQKDFTMDEVEHFDGEQDRPMYLVIGDCVYDFTDFADLHPGGPAPLKKHAGKDATDLLCNTGLTSDVLATVLLRFKVGSIIKA